MINVGSSSGVHALLKSLVVLLIALLGGVPLSGGATAMNPVSEKQVKWPTIRVINGGWGNSDVTDIQKVLTTVADVFPGQSLNGRRIAVRVVHRYGNPMVSYERTSEGEFVVFLTARNDRWYQFAYQFSHEFCHILSSFDRKGAGPSNSDRRQRSQWTALMT
jgi:hypothetical protein